jgi:AcrR family transcriptional regulator
MGTPATPTRGRRGPQPALAPDVERRMILDAALRVLRASGYDRATLDEVLAEASLSTRAFYRHFSSMEELLGALHREETRVMAAHLSDLAAAAPGPAEALRAWVDDLLAIAYVPRRAARAGLLRSRASRSPAGWEENRRAALAAVTGPLVGVLRAGRDDGTFPAADPELDARSICVVVLDLLDEIRAGRRHLSRDEATAHVLRFAHAPLGYAPNR